MSRTAGLTSGVEARPWPCDGNGDGDGEGEEDGDGEGDEAAVSSKRA